MSHTVGVLVREGLRPYIEPVIRKDTPLPADAKRAYLAAPNACVEVYEVTQNEGGPAWPDEHRRRGRLDLENPGAVGEVVLAFEVDESGLLRIEARYPPDQLRELELKDTGRWSTDEAPRLREKVLSIRMLS
jgi:hypothetical protein